MLFGLLWVVTGCAMQVPPTGGDKDTTPPKIESSSPDNFSTEFRADRVVWSFDEYVRLNNMTRELVVSPPMEEAPEFTVKGKRVIMKLHDELLPNTTYNVNLGAGIVDFNEGNPLDSNLFVFSTGPFLDSLSVNGVLVDAFTGLPAQEMVVMLYQDTTDSVPYLQKPYYLTRTNETGGFQLNYLAPGDYKFFALSDKNSNYKLDAAAEAYGFITNTVSPNDSVVLRVKVFREAFSELKVKKSRTVTFGQAYISFTLPVSELELEPLHTSFTQQPVLQWNEEHDSVVVWFPELPEVDTLLMKVRADTLIDTLRWRFPSYETFLKKKEKGKADVVLETTLATVGGSHDYFDSLEIRSNHPLVKADLNHVIFAVGNDTLNLDTLGLESWWADTTLTQPDYRFGPESLIFPYTWSPGKSYSLTLLPGALQDIFGLTNDTLLFGFNTLKFEDYGNLLVRLDMQEELDTPLIIERLNEKGNVIDRQPAAHQSELVYNMLRPGKFRLRLIVDRNENGRWDPGNYMENLQPEPVYYFPEVIGVRANWDIDYDWIIEASHVHDESHVHTE